MNEEKWKGFEWIWTTRAQEYCLAQTGSDPSKQMICHITPDTVEMLVIEDDDVYEAVKNKMRATRMRVMSRDDLQTLKNERRHVSVEK